jgi:hypothetical protein
MQSIGFDALPLWAVFIAVLLIVLVSVECGYRVGRYRRIRHEQGEQIRALLRDYVGARLEEFGRATLPREYAGRRIFNTNCGRKRRPSERKMPIRLWSVCSSSRSMR